MKRTLLFATLLIASCTTVQCMDQRRLLENNSSAMERGVREYGEDKCPPYMLQIKYGDEITCRSRCCCLWDIECDQAGEEGCAHCCSSACCCLCVAGAIAGVITGCVYFVQWTKSCDSGWYNPDCYNSTTPSNVTYANLTQLVKSKME